MIAVDESQLCVQLNAWFLRQSEVKLRQYMSQQPIVVSICSEFFQKKRFVNEQIQQNDFTQQENEPVETLNETLVDNTINAAVNCIGEQQSQIDQPPPPKRIKQEPVEIEPSGNEL